MEGIGDAAGSIMEAIRGELARRAVSGETAAAT
jgi:hypothetical protein